MNWKHPFFFKFVTLSSSGGIMVAGDLYGKRLSTIYRQIRKVNTYQYIYLSTLCII